MKGYTVHTDGGSRGNPGPAAIGVVIGDEKGNVLKEYGEYIGETTNNEAEYRAVISSLKKIKALWGKKEAKEAVVKVCVDSELVVKQMNHEYKIENPQIQKFFLELWNLTLDFKEVSFTSIPREHNREADSMVNEALDAQGSRQQLF
ncbi:ribonuclease HI family protein [Patescibacteria group bacterium]|nr:ribonuclease HI family protein [Patescibacteria group bacterium]